MSIIRVMRISWGIRKILLHLNLFSFVEIPSRHGNGKVVRRQTKFGDRYRQHMHFLLAKFQSLNDLIRRERRLAGEARRHFHGV